MSLAPPGLAACQQRLFYGLSTAAAYLYMHGCCAQPSRGPDAVHVISDSNLLLLSTWCSCLMASRQASAPAAFFWGCQLLSQRPTGLLGGSITVAMKPGGRPGSAWGLVANQGRIASWLYLLAAAIVVMARIKGVVLVRFGA